MTEVIIKNKNELKKELTYGDLKIGDWFIFPHSDILMIKSGNNWRGKGDKTALHHMDGHDGWTNNNDLVTRLSKVTITYEVE